MLEWYCGEEPWVIRVTKSVPVDENGQITTYNHAVEFEHVDLLAEQIPYSTEEFSGYWIHGAYNANSRSDEPFDILICDISYVGLDTRGQKIRNHKAWEQLMRALEGEVSPIC